MAILEIVEWPAKVLETRAEEVINFDDDFREFVQNMHETMDHANGIGLAANQVNKLLRVLTIHIPYNSDCEEEESEPKQWWHDKRFTFVNPVITKKKGSARYLEGCLSFPEVFDYVNRADTITLEAKNEHGDDISIEADGLFSICLQHEIDHIDGVVFINRMSRLKAQMIKKKINKRQLLGTSKAGKQ